jgi:hypothetical protein
MATLLLDHGQVAVGVNNSKDQSSEQQTSPQKKPNSFSRPTCFNNNNSLGTNLCAFLDHILDTTLNV